MQAAEPIDPEFVTALSTSVRGIFAVQVRRFTPQQVESDFRKAVRDPSLTANTRFMDNLLFVVRKKDVAALRGDVETLLGGPPLQPAAEVSAMKTLYALGGDRERGIVDERFARRLFADLRGGNTTPNNPYLRAADRIGGPLTLQVLRAALPEAVSRQRAAESAGDHVRIGELDEVRMTLETASLALSRKGAALALPQPQRDVELLKLYLSRAGRMGPWGYRELVRLSSPATTAAVRGFLARNLDSILPPSGLKPEDRSSRLQDARLRTLVLLQDLKAPLSAEEQKLVESSAAAIRESPESYRPDWEAVLDGD